ncbi:MAG TPA: TadE family protein [Candidatus Limnocylindrales bacterium]|nr:TadE family protein [Candidatus Limnocylindrales bacterium]
MTARVRPGRRARGQALAEFAFVFPIIALLAFGFIDVGRAVLTANTLTNAARQGARVAAVNQIDPGSGPWACREDHPVEDPSDPQWTFRGCATAAGAVAGLDPANVAIVYEAPPGSSIECTSEINVGCIATVTVTADFVPVTPVAGQVIGTIAMSASSSMPVERLFP